MPFPDQQYRTKIVAIRDLFDGTGFNSEQAIIVPEYQRDFNWDSELVERLYISL